MSGDSYCCEHERILIEAITKASQQAGLIRHDIEMLSGPDCLMVLEDMAALGESRRMEANERQAVADVMEEIYVWAMDACHQGAGEPFGSTPGWHSFISTWEEADELLPRFFAAWKAVAAPDRTAPETPKGETP